MVIISFFLEKVNSQVGACVERYKIVSTIRSALLVVFTSSLQKILSLVFGVSLLWSIDTQAYEDFVYMTVYSVMYTLLISSGVAPSLLKNIAKSNGKEKINIISDYYRVVFISSILLIFVFLIFFAFFSSPVDDLTPLFLLGISTVFSSLTTPVLQILNKSSSIIRASFVLLFFLFVSIICCFIFGAGWAQYLYSFSFFIYACSLLFSLYSAGFFYLGRIIKRLGFREYILDFRIIVKDVRWIFLANSSWMIAIFYFHSVIKTTAVINDTYVWFGIGYQIFSVLVFIPNSLSPLVIRFFSSNSEEVRKVVLFSFGYMSVSFIMSLIIYLFLLWFAYPGSDYVFFASLAGAVASGISPLDQFYIAGNKSVCMIPVAMLFIISLYVLFYFFPINYHVVFFSSYVMCYLLLILMLFIVKRIR